jgi:hypothetical protein
MLLIRLPIKLKLLTSSQFKVHKSGNSHVPYEKIYATISGMNIQSFHKDASIFPILDDVSLAAVIERTQDPLHRYPTQKVC